tara:strand:- start:216 stop:434 length:219 start_codon:yes stop_codon:yes gene_type:complete
MPTKKELQETVDQLREENDKLKDAVKMMLKMKEETIKEMEDHHAHYMAVKTEALEMMKSMCYHYDNSNDPQS